MNKTEIQYEKSKNKPSDKNEKEIVDTLENKQIKVLAEWKIRAFFSAFDKKDYGMLENIAGQMSIINDKWDDTDIYKVIEEELKNSDIDTIERDIEVKTISIKWDWTVVIANFINSKREIEKWVERKVKYNETWIFEVRQFDVVPIKAVYVRITN